MCLESDGLIRNPVGDDDEEGGKAPRGSLILGPKLGLGDELVEGTNDAGPPVNGHIRG